MPFRRYRLAAPIDNTQVVETTTLVLYQPTSSRPLSIRSQLVTSVNTNTRTKLVLPDDAEEVRHAVTTESSLRWWLVLPPLAVIMFVSAASPLLLNDLFEYREQKRYESHESKVKQDTGCRQSQWTPMPTHYWPFPPDIQRASQEQSGENRVQKGVSQLHIKNSLATLFPALFVFLLLGCNCDIIGRRPLIFLPFVGKIIYNSLFIIIVSYDLSNLWLIIIHALDVGFGSHGLVVVGALAYISDCTIASDRTRAFFIVEITIIVMRVTPMLAVGLYWRRYQHLYVVPLSIFLVLSVIGLLYVMFIQPESIANMRKNSLVRQLSLVRLKPIKRLYVTFAAKRSGHNRQKLILITLAIILLLIVHFGYSSMYILYLYGRPFCMNALSISLLASAQALLILLLTLLAVRFKQQMESNYLPSMIGAFAIIINLFLFGLAKVVWVLYVAASIGSLYFVAQPVLRSKATKLVRENEYAVVFIAVGIIESVGHHAIGLLSNTVYKMSLHFFPGLVFLVFAVIGFVAIAIMGYLCFIDWKECSNIGGKTNATPSADDNA